MEEEILIVLDGVAEVVLTRDPADPQPIACTLRPGEFSYYPAWQYHTIRNTGYGPVTYCMFKWVGLPALHRGTVMGAQVVDYRPLRQATDARVFSPRVLFDSATGWLNRFHCHLTDLKPGGGYDAHADPYDVALLILSGRVEVNGRVLDPYTVAYFSAGEPHGMLNPGEIVATYLVFEFDADGPEINRQAPESRG